MAAKCKISGTSRQFGHRVSHANNKTKHSFLPNLQTRRFYLAEEKRTVKIRVTTRMIRTIDKLGLKETLRKYKVPLSEILA